MCVCVCLCVCVYVCVWCACTYVCEYRRVKVCNSINIVNCELTGFALLANKPWRTNAELPFACSAVFALTCCNS